MYPRLWSGQATSATLHVCVAPQLGSVVSGINRYRLRSRPCGEFKSTNLKYLFWLLLLFSMASREPMPLYFFSLTPSEKKYSPGASVVAASREPIITAEVKVEG